MCLCLAGLFGLLPVARADDTWHAGLNVPESAADLGHIRDSLELILRENQSPDSVRVHSMLALAWVLKSAAPRQALEYARMALAEATELSLIAEQAAALNHLGIIFWQMGDFNQALEYLLQSNELFHLLEPDVKRARNFSNIGLVLSSKGQYERALEYYLKAHALSAELADSVGLSRVLNNIGLIYQEKNDYITAEDYHRQSLEIKMLLGDRRGMAFSFNNLGVVKQGLLEYESALEYFRQALAIRETLPDLRELANTLSNIGYQLLLTGNAAEASSFLKRALRMYLTLDDQYGITQCYHYLGHVAIAGNNPSQAISYFSRSLSLAKSVQAPLLITENYKGLSLAFAQAGDYQQAYENQLEFVALRDSLKSEESQQRIIEMQILYDRERKEREIESLKNENQIRALNAEKNRILRNFLIGLMLVFLIMLFLITNRYQFSKKANMALQSQRDEILEANRMRDTLFSIISHDLRNPFSSIVSFSRILKRDIDHLSRDELIELVNELDEAVGKINTLLNNLLQWSKAQAGKIAYSPVEVNVSVIVDENIQLFSQALSAKKLKVSKEIHDALNIYADTQMTDSILRNLLSNAIKYSHEGSTISITASEENGFVRIQINDQGVGIDADRITKLFSMGQSVSTHGTAHEKGSGLGLPLCREFAEMQHGEIGVQSEPGKGSSFYVLLPARKK